MSSPLSLCALPTLPPQPRQPLPLSPPTVPEILQRAKLLPSDDQKLLHLALAGHYSTREIAAVLKCHPGTVSRRIRALRQRLESPVAESIYLYSHTLARDLRELALAHFILNQPLHVLCTQLGLTLRELNRQVDYIKAWAILAPQLDAITK
jgi:hypothetical protein